MTVPLPLYTEITGTLTVLSPLHVGSGLLGQDDAIPRDQNDRSGSNTSPLSARVECDGNGAPYLPGTGLKGVLRSFAEPLGSSAAESLFGTIKDETSGEKGLLTVFGATFCDAPAASGLPLHEALSSKNRRARALAARTAVDAGRGTADHAKLFFAECVVPDTTFRFRARLRPTEDRGAIDLLKQLLASLKAGLVAFGRGTADGDGRMRLDGITATNVSVNPTNGSIIKTEDKAFLSGSTQGQRAGSSFSLTLTCDGPYFVQDWTFKPKRKPGDDEETAGPQVKALCDHHKKPALPGTSLMGALRSRAAWLAKINGKPNDVITDLFGAAPDAGNSASKARLLVDEVIFVSAGTEVTMTSVKLDRFSGGPIDGGLFGTACVADPVFRAELRLHPKVTTKALAFLRDILLPDLMGNGLKLGHSGTRGFGWFKVSGNVSTLKEAAHVG